MHYKSFMEALKGKQHKIDKNKNGKIDAHDFKLLRKEEAEQLDEVGDTAKGQKLLQLVNKRAVSRLVSKKADTDPAYAKKAQQTHLAADSRLKEEFEESYEFNRAALAKQRLQNLRHSGRKVRGASVANLMRAAGIREEEMEEQDLDQLDEVLGKDATASDWIHDFVHSTNPKFEGKTKKERIKMALGAYYDKAREKQQNEQVHKPDVPAYLRKQQGQAPLKLSDLKRKDTISDKENLAKLRNEDVKEPTGDLKDACWTGYTAVGMKMKNGKKVPNCVPVKEETDTSEKHSMAENQLHFIKYAAEEILEYIEMGGQIEEWYQNKLSKVQSEVESLHSYVEGESRRQGMKEETKRAAGAVNVDKVHSAGQEPHEEKFETYKKKAVKEEYDEEGNVTYPKISLAAFMEAMTATQVRPGVTRYTGGSYGSAKGAKYGNTDYDKETLDTKDDEGENNQPQKRGRGRPAGAKSGARGPRIK